jgi:glycosyltransferase involved in cell wall biosynthesis
MSLGFPLICTPVGAHKDVISDGVNGFFVKPGDTEMIAQKIITMLEDSEKRNQIAETNYKYVRNNFHIYLIARQMEKYIEQVININD